MYKIVITLGNLSVKSFLYFTADLVVYSSRIATVNITRANAVISGDQALVEIPRRRSADTSLAHTCRTR